MADGKVNIFARARGPTEITAVSSATEIRIPLLTWLALMFFVPSTFALIWLGGWALWLYDAIQNGRTFYYWYARMFSPWWESGGWVLFVLTVCIVGAFVATGLTAYRFWTEQGAKAWDARDGPWYPGRSVGRE